MRYTKFVIYNITGLPLFKLPIPEDLERILDENGIADLPCAERTIDLGLSKNLTLQIRKRKSQATLSYFAKEEDGR